jgi:DNA-binding NtrC family response regulator
MARVVLVVDGDPATGALFRRAARELPLEVAQAATADEAWKLLFLHRPLAVFTEYRLLGFDGISLLELVARYFPAAKRILHTGETLGRTARGLDIPVLGKPCDEASLTGLLGSLQCLPKAG